MDANNANDYVAEFSFTTDELLDELQDRIIDRSKVGLRVTEKHI